MRLFTLPHFGSFSSGGSKKSETRLKFCSAMFAIIERDDVNRPVEFVTAL